MTSSNTCPKPSVYRGQPLPLGQLSEDDFEDFTFCVLEEFGKKRGFQIISGRQPSGDGGFDITAKSDDDGHLICIQCKRYKSSLNVTTVALELAKVALTTKLEGSVVKEYYLISTGTIATKLRSILRQQSRQYLIDESIKKLEHKDLQVLIKRCKVQKIDSEDIVKHFITSLDNLIVWSGTDFDNILGTIWSKITDTVNRYFSLDIVIEQYPRPDFDLDNYIKDIRGDEQSIIELSLYQSALPYNLRKHDTNNVLSNDEQAIPRSHQHFKTNEIILSTPLNQCRVLTGPGGGGKSTTLFHAQKAIVDSQKESDIQILPIYLRLSSYSENLDELIHHQLHIVHGHWTSLPYHFFILLDGVDEIPDLKAQMLFDELTTLNGHHKLIFVISLRETGLRLPVNFECIESCYNLQALSYRDCADMAEKLLPEKDRESFFYIFRQKAHTFGSKALTLPFGLSVAIKYYRQHKKLPDSFEKLLYNIIKNRVTHNRTRTNVKNSGVNLTSSTTIIKFAKAISFEFRVVIQKSAVSQEEGETIVVSALQRIKGDGVFGAHDLSDEKAFSIAIHYEILHLSSDGMFYIDHDILADYLASSLLASNWQDYTNKITSIIGQDVWVFSARHIPENQKNIFLEKILNEDIVLAARCAIAMGENYYPLIEDRIFIDNKSESLLIAHKAVTAMSIIRSQNCIQQLTDNLTTPNRHRRYQAERALAAAGVPEFLEHCLNENESAKAAGLNPSGGSYDMWFIGPPMVVTDIARKNIKQSLNDEKKFVPIALETIESFGDKSDIDSVRSIVLSTKNVSEFYSAVRCLYGLDKEVAFLLLNDLSKKIDSEDFSLYAMNCLHEYGQILDVTKLFHSFIDLNEVKPEQHSTVEVVVKLLKEHPLPKDADYHLVEALEQADDLQFYNLWDIAVAHKFNCFRALAWKAMEGDSVRDICTAIDYGNACFTSEDDRKTYTRLCIDQANKFRLQPQKFIWVIEKLLDALIKLNEKYFAANIITELLMDYFPQYLDPREAESDDNKQSKEKSDLSFFLKHELVQILKYAVKVKDLLDIDTLSGIVDMDVSSSCDETKRSYTSLLSMLPAAILDTKISAIKDICCKTKTLASICLFEKTSKREAMIINIIPVLLTHHFYNDDLIKLANAYWSPLFANTLIKAVSEFPWDPMSSQLFDSVLPKIASLITKDDSRDYIYPILDSVTNTEAKNILSLWHDYAINSDNIY